MHNTTTSEFQQALPAMATEQPAATTAAAASATDRESSLPLPERHTAVAPGPRATRLLELYASSLAHTLSRISAPNFAACYPTVAARAPGVLAAVRKGMVGRLAVMCEV